MPHSPIPPKSPHPTHMLNILLSNSTQNLERKNSAPNSPNTLKNSLQQTKSYAWIDQHVPANKPSKTSLPTNASTTIGK